MLITIYGSGYVGLVTAACLSEVGHSVLCVDVDRKRVDSLNAGETPIFEPGLEEMVHRNRASGRLRFTTSAEDGVAHGVVQFVAVGTPPDDTGGADLRFIRAVATTIGDGIDGYRLICIKSTVPVGTADTVRSVIQQRMTDRGIHVEFDVASNPEFLKEGAAITDFMKPDRIIIGTDHQRATEMLHELYAPFNRNHDRMMVMDVRSAELTKYAANAMLATRISLMNELANLAERVGANIEKVRIGIGSDPRIGYRFLYAGCGFGGSCFPKDISALIHTAETAGYQAELLNAVHSVNARQKRRLFEKISQHYDHQLKGKVFALWGLSFKPNTDDVRDAPSRTLMEALWSAGASVQAYDPVATKEIQAIYGTREDLVLCKDKESAMKGADALVILTEWMEFRSPDFSQIRGALKQAVVFDGRNLYEPQQMAREGIIYYGIGIGTEAG